MLAHKETWAGLVSLAHAGALSINLRGRKGQSTAIGFDLIDRLKHTRRGHLGREEKGNTLINCYVSRL
jgi:hypothetical protein